ncbi:MAG: hypothetical protein FJY85_22875, partial [Deltaproteobacteria bacterium]|nr:hypothetical protein [Deltaproteobacteria bacterium]
MQHDTCYEVPDYTHFRMRKVAVLPVQVNLSKQCLLNYEQGGLVRPTDEEIESIFYPLIYRAVQDRGYDVVGLAEMESALDAEGLKSIVQIYDYPPVRLGNILGVDGLIYFTVRDVTSIIQIQFDARIVETRHGLILWYDRYFKTGRGGFGGSVIEGTEWLVSSAGAAAVPFTAGASLAAGSAGRKLGDTMYKAITSMEKEIRVGVDDCMSGLPAGGS